MNFDIIIKNGTIINGTGNPGFKANIGIKNGKITAIKPTIKQEAKRIINAEGKVISPGFIDIHSHTDSVLPFDQHVVSTIHQGITTLVVGMCGYSIAPYNKERKELFDKILETAAPAGLEYNITWELFSEYMDEMEKLGCSSNVAFLIGFGPVRMAAMGYENRKPTQKELAKMKAYIRDAMEAGAFGLSTGLIYTPQAYAETDEVLEVAKEVGKYDGLYFSHIRNEGEYVVEAVQEVIDIVEQSGCSGGQIAHHKVAGKEFWGLSKKTLQLIEAANDRGISITCDQYPYNRGMTSLDTLLPPWTHEGGVTKLLERLKNKKDKKEMKKDLLEGKSYESFVKNNGWDCIYVASLETEKWKKHMGKSLTKIAEELGIDDVFELLCKILIDEKSKPSMTIESMGDEDIHHIMTHKYTMVGTDGSSLPLKGPLSEGMPHPRFFGTFPRILGHYVREKQVMPLETAIRKMTSFPAQRLGLIDRGLLMPNFWADIVIFNSKSIIDTATFLEPKQLPQGIEYVLVNGEVVISEGNHLMNKPGMVLRKKLDDY